MEFIMTFLHSLCVKLDKNNRWYSKEYRIGGMKFIMNTFDALYYIIKQHITYYY